jgi:hypothetical protein
MYGIMIFEKKITRVLGIDLPIYLTDNIQLMSIARSQLQGTYIGAYTAVNSCYILFMAGM